MEKGEHVRKKTKSKKSQAIYYEVPLVQDRLQSCWPQRLIMMVVIMIPIYNKRDERPPDLRWRDPHW